MLLLLACISVHDDEDHPVVVDDDGTAAAEGDDPGECTDGADNDLDGAFDCDDSQCAGSPDCDADTGSDSDSDSDSDTGLDDTADDTGDTAADTGHDTDDSPLDEFSSYELVYSFAWNFDDAYSSYLEAYGLGDCVTTYAGSGAVHERVATRLTFYGPWAPVDTDCNENLVGVIWYDERRDSYASFTFSDDLSRLEDWVQHLDDADYEPVDEPMANQQWYVTEMAAAFDLAAGTAHYTLDESITVDIIPVVITHTVDVHFLR